MKPLTKTSFLKLVIIVSLLFIASCSKDDDKPIKEGTEAETEVTITVSNFSTSIDENPENGEIIGQVDANTNTGSLTFSIIEQTPENAFYVDSATGELIVTDASLFDFETNPKIIGTVKVANGDISENASVEINIKDVFEDKVFEGNVKFETQQAVNEFGLNEYTHINGALTIGFFEDTNISDLTPLNTIRKVDKQINIITNPNLTNLDGLDNLEEIGGYLAILYNNSLTDISSLQNLKNIGERLSIESNSQLVNLNGLENLTILRESLRINDNKSLENMDALSNITSIGTDLAIDGNDKLLSLSLPRLATVGGDLSITSNESITNLDNLNSLNSIGGDLKIILNFSLVDFCGITGVLKDGYFEGEYTVYYNAYDPTQQNIIDGNCSL